MPIKTVMLAVMMTGTVLLIGLAASQAHKGASGIVKQRMNAMEDMGRQMKRLGAVAKGEVVFDGAAVAAMGKSLARHAREMPAQFPKGSVHGPSEAKPIIWREWDEFARQVQALETHASALERVAQRGQAAALPAIIAIGKTCNACHDKFREKKKR